MKLSKKEILNLANLAKLKLKEEEIILYQKQLRSVLNYVNKIKELKLDKIKESISGVDSIIGELREDLVKDSKQVLRKQALENKDNYIIVSKVLDK